MVLVGCGLGASSAASSLAFIFSRCDNVWRCSISVHSKVLSLVLVSHGVFLGV